MSKIIVISAESSTPNELDIVREMFSVNSNFRLHLRKPNWSENQFIEFLNQIDPRYYDQISIHNYLYLTKEFIGVSAHYSAKMREGKKGNSTSFHSKKEVMEMHKDFNYFFCSPVFNSISKKGYSTDENWDINLWPNDLKEKSVALGGMSANKLPVAKKLGFKNYAFLGEIWLSEDPLTAFKNILNHVK